MTHASSSAFFFVFNGFTFTFGKAFLCLAEKGV